MNKIAIISGIGGQDGTHLANYLLSLNYKVIGIVRRNSTSNEERLKLIKSSNLELVYGDITDAASIDRIVCEYEPDEFYHLAANSFVGCSWKSPIHIMETNTCGTINSLESLRKFAPECRFYFAGSSEQFGDYIRRQKGRVILDENSPMIAASPYGVSKVAGYQLTKVYRESYDMFASCGILFNHCSELRGQEFFTRKITSQLAKIKLGLQETIKLGNLTAKRDEGYAGDYCINLDVPILTPNGWKYYDDLVIGDEIINFNLQNNTLTRDKVLNKILLNSTGDKIKLTGRGTHLNVTPNHSIYFKKKNSNNKGRWSHWNKIKASEFYDLFKDKSLRSKYDYIIPNFSNSSIIDHDPDFWTNDRIYLLGVLLAEGCSYQSYGGGYQVSLSQSYIVNENIFNKIEDIIKKLHLKYSKNMRNDGVCEWKLDSESSKIVLSWFDSYNLHVMPTVVYSFSQQQAEILFNALMDCDGHWGGLTYVSKRSLLAFDFQTIAHLAGYRTTEPTQRRNNMWSVCVIAKRKKNVYITEVDKYNDGHNRVWCVETTNGTIITRDSGCINISGNCKAMHLILQHNKSDDFVIASGESHSCQEWLELSLHYFGLNKGVVNIDENLFRPNEVHELIGDSSKARELLNWRPRISYPDLNRRMCKYDMYKQSNNQSDQEVANNLVFKE